MELKLPHCGAPVFQVAADCVFSDLYDVDGGVKAFGVPKAHATAAQSCGS
jgi:hypothetical protein